jgi:hypothetical protein
MGLKGLAKGVVVESLQVGGGDDHTVAVTDMSGASHANGRQVGLLQPVTLQDLLDMTGHHADHTILIHLHMGTGVNLIQYSTFIVNKGDGTFGSPDIDPAKYSWHWFRNLVYVLFAQ